MLQTEISLGKSKQNMTTLSFLLHKYLYRHFEYRVGTTREMDNLPILMIYVSIAFACSTCSLSFFVELNAQKKLANESVL